MPPTRRPGSYLDGTYRNVDTLIDVLTRFAVGVLTLEGGLEC